MPDINAAIAAYEGEDWRERTPDPKKCIRRMRAALTAADAASWQTMASAPKSSVDSAGRVRGHYLLGYCPDEGISPEACVDVIWWEPLTLAENGTLGCWYSGLQEVRPILWRPMPVLPAPAQITSEEKVGG